MTTGVVVMAYGTPASPADVEAYYTHIRRGRAPAPEQLAELAGRYQAIGGVSPLAERTRAHVDAIAGALTKAREARLHILEVTVGAGPEEMEDVVAHRGSSARDLTALRDLLLMAFHEQRQAATSPPSARNQSHRACGHAPFVGRAGLFSACRLRFA